MNADGRDFAKQYVAQARHSLCRHHLPRIARCLRMLTEKQVWRRAHPASNGVGNLVLHLEGNVQQWIVSGLGGAPDRRRRDQEFAAQGPIPKRRLLARLRKAVAEADRVLKSLSPQDLARRSTVQGFHVTGLKVLGHVTEHFAQHTGQIIFATKHLRGRDLRLTQLPGEKGKRGKARRLPAI